MESSSRNIVRVVACVAPALDLEMVGSHLSITFGVRKEKPATWSPAQFKGIRSASAVRPIETLSARRLLPPMLCMLCTCPDTLVHRFIHACVFHRYRRIQMENYRQACVLRTVIGRLSVRIRVTVQAYACESESSDVCMCLR